LPKRSDARFADACMKEATVTRIGLYNIVKSTTLESNKSLDKLSEHYMSVQ
jgi:hypothetical protein